mgnify:CR=1 FL=1
MRLALFSVILLASQSTGCDPSGTPESATGVTVARAKVEKQSNGLTTEQDNVRHRIQAENIPGSLKHLYIVSAYSGEVILYSTVKGKITSSGKRLTPYQVSDVLYSQGSGFPIDIGSQRAYTKEVLQDDGTYGSSIEYLYWWDQNDVYHQQYVTGGMVLHVADQPMEFGSVTINVEAKQANPN